MASYRVSKGRVTSSTGSSTSLSSFSGNISKAINSLRTQNNNSTPSSRSSSKRKTTPIPSTLQLDLSKDILSNNPARVKNAEAWLRSYGIEPSLYTKKSISNALKQSGKKNVEQKIRQQLSMKAEYKRQTQVLETAAREGRTPYIHEIRSIRGGLGGIQDARKLMIDVTQSKINSRWGPRITNLPLEESFRAKPTKTIDVRRFRKEQEAKEPTKIQKVIEYLIPYEKPDFDTINQRKTSLIPPKRGNFVGAFSRRTGLSKREAEDELQLAELLPLLKLSPEQLKQQQLLLPGTFTAVDKPKWFEGIKGPQPRIDYEIRKLEQRGEYIFEISGIKGDGLKVAAVTLPLFTLRAVKTAQKTVKGILNPKTYLVNLPELASDLVTGGARTQEALFTYGAEISRIPYILPADILGTIAGYKSAQYLARATPKAIKGGIKIYKKYQFKRTLRKLDVSATDSLWEYDTFMSKQPSLNAQRTLFGMPVSEAQLQMARRSVGDVVYRGPKGQEVTLGRISSVRSSAIDYPMGSVARDVVTADLIKTTVTGKGVLNLKVQKVTVIGTKTMILEGGQKLTYLKIYTSKGISFVSPERLTNFYTFSPQAPQVSLAILRDLQLAEFKYFSPQKTLTQASLVPPIKYNLIETLKEIYGPGIEKVPIKAIKAVYTPPKPSPSAQTIQIQELKQLTKADVFAGDVVFTSNIYTPSALAAPIQITPSFSFPNIIIQSATIGTIGTIAAQISNLRQIPLNQLVFKSNLVLDNLIKTKLRLRTKTIQRLELDNLIKTETGTQQNLVTQQNLQLKQELRLKLRTKQILRTQVTTQPQLRTTTIKPITELPPPPPTFIIIPELPKLHRKLHKKTKKVKLPKELVKYTHTIIRAKKKRYDIKLFTGTELR